MASSPTVEPIQLLGKALSLVDLRPRSRFHPLPKFKRFRFSVGIDAPDLGHGVGGEDGFGIPEVIATRRKVGLQVSIGHQTPINERAAERFDGGG